MSRTLVFCMGSLVLASGAVTWVIVGKPSRPASPPVTAVDTARTPKKTRAASASGLPAPAGDDDGVSVYFSPNGGCTEAIVHDIRAAKICIYVQSAQFTYAPIAKALVAAKERGVDVQVVMDQSKNDDGDSELDRLVGGSVPTFIDGKHHTAHNKVILMDHAIIYTGSFNLTRVSETENAENLVRIEGKAAVMSAYEANFREHLNHSKRTAK